MLPKVEAGDKSNNRNEKILKAFGANLKKLREAKGLTTREFARIAGIGYSQVWRLETGQVNPSLTTLLAILLTLDVPLKKLAPFK